MKTVGQNLKEVREAKFYTLEEVEKATKIRKELLEALEKGDYVKLPPATFIQGFIKNYAKFLNLDSEKLLAIFRREYAENKHQPYVMDAFSHPPNESKLRITPGRVIGGVISLIVLVFFVYLWFQYHQLAGSPNLSLSSPIDQYTASEHVVLVEGKTDPEVKVLINSTEVPVDGEGNFKEEINLSSQVTKIIVLAVSKFGQKIQLERTVYLKSIRSD